MSGTLFHPKEDVDERRWPPARTAGLVVAVSSLLWVGIFWLLAALA